MVIKIRQGQADDGGFIINKNMHITRRELEALAYVGMGLDNKEVADKLGVSVNTARNHIWNVMKKLGATSRANAVIMAVQNEIFAISPKRSLETFVQGVDRYVLCPWCGKAYMAREYVEAEPERLTINHVDYEDIEQPAWCPTKGCSADISMAIPWEDVLYLHPEYPEIPEKGIEYDTDAEFLVREE